MQPKPCLSYDTVKGQNINVLYNLAKGLGTQRADGSDSRFPTKCMPMGLIEYAAEFFANDNVRQVCPVYAGNTTYTSIAFSDFMST